MNASQELIGVTPSQIECMVRELFKRRQDVRCEPPIRLEWLIENEENVQLETVMGLRAAHGVEGGIWKQEGSRQLTVFVDYGICIGPWPEYAAVLAEEFAHLVLHRALLIQVKSIEDFIALQKNPEWERYERDARRYSRALRMPAGPFVFEAQRLYEQVVAGGSFGDVDTVEKLVRNGLCQKFRVPHDDALRRMLTYPCEISRRIQASVLSYSPTLLPAGAVLTHTASVQKSLIGLNLD
jgi:hypothetical protein